MSLKDNNYRTFLQEELIARQKRNGSYSLRAFARDLGVPVSRLSEVLNGKNGISRQTALTIAERLKLSSADRQLFIDLVQAEHGRSKLERQEAQARVQSQTNFSLEIENNEFSVISEWYHLPILEVLKLGDHNTQDTIAKKLDLDVNAVAAALVNLKKIGLVTEREGEWFPVHTSGAIKSGFPSKSIQMYHRQIIERSLIALTEKPVEERDFSSMVFIVNKEQVDHAKERIRQFRRSLMRELEAVDGQDAVYCLSMQLFELTV